MPSKAAVDLSEFIALSGRPRDRCTLAVAFDELGPQDQAKLRAALAEPTISHAAIGKWLTARGRRTGGHTVGRHRKGECSCVR